MKNWMTPAVEELNVANTHRIVGYYYKFIDNEGNLLEKEFIVKEKINYPQIGSQLMRTVVDTVKVYRPKTETLQ